MKKNTRIVRYKQASFVALLSVYFLILVGGIVRSTGAGMGCPDWPRCFGQWVPPTSESELPDDYKTEFVKSRLEKNERFAGYLSFLGFDDLAEEIITSKLIGQETSFNVTKTWTEYLNRLVGALVGLFILGTLFFSIPLLKSKSYKPLIISTISVVLVGLQGWIGSVVVSTNLTPWMITIHMLIALIIVALLSIQSFTIFADAKKIPFKNESNLKLVLAIGIILTLVQIVMGTQVREAINEIAYNTDRENWIAKLGNEFYVHRSFSWLLLVAQLIAIYFLRKNPGQSNKLTQIAVAILLVSISEMFVGGIMAWFGVPAFAQPIHLLNGTLIFGMQFYLISEVYSRASNEKTRKQPEQYAIS